MDSIFEDQAAYAPYEQLLESNGWLAGPEKLSLEVLEWPPVFDTDALSSSPLISLPLNDLSTRPKPRLRIIFAPLDIATHENSAGLLQLFRDLSVPTDFVNQRSRQVTHSFFAHTGLSSHTSWFHSLCKNLSLHKSHDGNPYLEDSVRVGLSQADWSWLRSSFFLDWRKLSIPDECSVTFVVFSPSLELDRRFQRMWHKTTISSILKDPFALYAIVLDELWTQAEAVLRTAGELFGPMEYHALRLSSRGSLSKDQPDFAGLHNVAKHIIHIKEGASAALSTSRLLLDHHVKFLKLDPQSEAIELVHRKLEQKVVQFEVWELQASSLERRMQNVINLSFNVVTQRDSNNLKQDSRSMKAIATVTVGFLPAATVAAIFGSEFFNYNATSNRIAIANNFWIFWVLTVPLCAVVSILYYWLCYHHEARRSRKPQ